MSGLRVKAWGSGAECFTDGCDDVAAWALNTAPTTLLCDSCLESLRAPGVRATTPLSCPVEMYHSDDGRPVGPCTEGCYPDPCYADQDPVPPGRVICRRGHVLTEKLLKQHRPSKEEGS